MVETIKNVAAVVGAVLSCASLLTLICKPLRTALTDAIRKYSGRAEAEGGIAEINALLREHMDADRKFKADMLDAMDVSLEFAKTECRNIIKNMFYRYYDVEVLPLYEKKTLMSVRELYIDRLHCNSYAPLLLDEMSKWEVDYTKSYAEDED